MRWDGQVWTEFEANCDASDADAEDPEDWECTISTDFSELAPGAHRLEFQIFEDGTWSDVKIYYHTISAPQPEPSDDNNLPELSVDTSDEAFSIWIVFASVIGSIVALIGLYMIITLSKDEM